MPRYTVIVRKIGLEQSRAVHTNFRDACEYVVDSVERFFIPDALRAYEKNPLTGSVPSRNLSVWRNAVAFFSGTNTGKIPRPPMSDMATADLSGNEIYIFRS